MSKKDLVRALATSSAHVDWSRSQPTVAARAATISVRAAQVNLEPEQTEASERMNFESMREASIAKFKAKYPNGAQIEAANFFE